MDLRKIFPILVIFIAFYLTIVSAKKSVKDKSSHEVQLSSQEGQVEGISSELQVLKTLNNETTTTKKPKHGRRKNKHHQRGSHNQRGQQRGRIHKKKKQRTNPTDILTASDEFIMPANNGSKTKTRSGKHRDGSTKIKSNTRSRGTRHLDNLDGEREFTNGHSSGHDNHHKHHHKHHRLSRRRFHHKKHHKKAVTSVNEQPTLESPRLQDLSPSAIIP